MKYSTIYLNDLLLARTSIPYLNVIDNTKILVTGATGLIGSALVDLLSESGLNIDVYVGSRSKEAYRNRFSGRNCHYFEYDAEKEINTDISFDHIIHCASPAHPAAFSEKPVETMLANLIGTDNLLKHAIDNKTRRIVYVSSSEVYGTKDDNDPYMENDYGYLDITKPRACYPSSKRAAETLLAAYKAEYGIDYVTVRPGHVYGPTATAKDSRASSVFFYDVLNGHDIVMKSSGQQLRSYCYVVDCASAILTALTSGISGEAYNISNRESVCTIREIAECIAVTAGKKIVFENPSDKELQNYNFMNNSSLNADKLYSLGWKPLFDLQTGVKHTLESMLG